MGCHSILSRHVKSFVLFVQSYADLHILKACVVPRPIGWISTVSPTQSEQEPIFNLAPYSQFNNLTFDPPYVMFASNQKPTSTSPGFERKDTVRNAESTGYFCWQLATYPLREAVNITARTSDYSVDEFEQAGLEKTWSTSLPISVPMVKKSPVRFECQYYTTIRLPGNPPMGTVDVVVGRVLGIHIDDEVLSSEVDNTFEMIVENTDLYGLAGDAAENRKRYKEAEGHTLN
ncbi:flavo oxygenase [Fusarium pseudocircinatum]|uniref:Flavo oxygenase n=1 Tax=Fusarium pseudocircinatum TaxID=56676 RepID=A0A8H5PLC9_9HYPO|nr:flavo oxygenase [Fusarium pseudocircinatum]